MIEINNLVKTFDNAKAIDNLNFYIEEGAFVGLLGPNGAGKTTLLKLITTQLIADSGEILVDGVLANRKRTDIKKKFSVISQEFSLRNDFSVYEAMEHHGMLYEIPRKIRRPKIDELLKFCDLYEHKDKKIRNLSGGMKRKLMLCRALMTEPKYLFLDEPTVGLDPISRRQIWSLLYQLNSQGMTIILTTHYIEEAQFLCKSVALMNNGTIQAVKTAEEFISELGAFAVDSMHDGKIDTKFFNIKEEAMEFASQQTGKIVLRETTLEDVFIAHAGKGLNNGNYNCNLGKVD